MFLNLQQAGNVEHSGSILTFSCAQYDGREQSVFNEKVGKQLVQLLQDCAKEMEEALKNWEAEIHVARTQYYQLTYYTTLQLLTLRREFGQVKASDASCVPPNVLALLHSVSPQITNSTLRDVVCTTIQLQPFQIDRSNESMEEKIPLSEVIQSVQNSYSSVQLNDHGDNTQPLLGEVSSSRTSSIPKDPLKMTQHPSHIVNDLNDERKEILTHYVEFMGYSQAHVLRAFQECALDANRYDIQQWCDRNDDDYSDDDDDQEDGSESEDEEESQFSSSESSDESLSDPNPQSASGILAHSLLLCILILNFGI